MLLIGVCSRVIGIWKIVQLIFTNPVVKAAEVFFDGNVQKCARTNRLRLLDSDLIAGGPRLNQIIWQCNADFVATPPRSGLFALRPIVQAHR